ncbi:MAG: DUF5103 domain-containing protein [Lewinellaceae bacterium]|nr:DUF5103 domain-containing protein [Lewinella sp.]MCB9279861.1 DUF5103 domain-containing protein [Lewinellaceae bacterium]
MRYTTTVFALLIATAAFGQEVHEDVVYENKIYNDQIKSVKLTVSGLPLSLPIISLDSDIPLELNFDDLNQDYRDYSFTVVHCNMDWTPSNLVQLDYLDGFGEDQIEQYNYSSRTSTLFTHYSLTIPNNSMRLTKSGNYLLIVYDDEDERTPVITRRFMVVDSKVKVTANMVRPSKVELGRTHQEIDFAADYGKFQIRSPQQELRASVLQNNRWDMAVIGLSPNFTRLNAVVFDYQNQVVFPAGKEFRYLDMRSLRLGSETLAEYGYNGANYEAWQLPDMQRWDKPYIFRRDINGSFVIETKDQADQVLSAEYAEVFFTFKSEPFYDDELYIIGEMTDWKLKEEFRMVYNNRINGYICKALLKQGYYEYEYVLSPNKKSRDKPLYTHTETEGDWYETENQYTILIYYHPLGERYDQLIGYYLLNSNE